MCLRSIFCRWSGCCLLGLFVTMSAPAVVAGNVAQNIGHRAQNHEDQPNPWALPTQRAQNQRLNQRNGYAPQRLPEYRNQRYGRGQINNRPKHDRFVTPEILRSLNQQPIQNQLAPEDQNYSLAMPKPQKQQQYNMPPYGAPPYGMGYSPPMYDMPSSSPWTNNPDILYQNDSYPLVPNEAIGGIPPMQTPLFEGDKLEGMYTPELQNGNNVFNPFTFIPNNGQQ